MKAIIPIKLTWKKVRANCIKYMKRGKLQCQQKTFQPREGCLYNAAPGIRCAIGSSFTVTQVKLLKKKWLNDASIWTLLEEKLLHIPNDDLQKIKDLQIAHDTGIHELKKFLKDNK